MKDDGLQLGGLGKVVESEEVFISGKKKRRLLGQGRISEVNSGNAVILAS